jgi:hypothetical protein
MGTNTYDTKLVSLDSWWYIFSLYSYLVWQILLFYMKTWLKFDSLKMLEVYSFMDGEIIILHPEW